MRTTCLVPILCAVLAISAVSVTGDAQRARGGESDIVKESEVEYVRDVIRRVDRNRDGRVTLAEVRAARMQWLTELRAAVKAEEAGELDKNGEEIHAFVASIPWIHASEILGTGMFFALDTNGDGRLDHDEIVATFYDPNIDPTTPEQIRKARDETWRFLLEAYDANRDGRLDYAELWSIVAADELEEYANDVITWFDDVLWTVIPCDSPEELREMDDEYVAEAFERARLDKARFEELFDAHAEKFLAKEEETRKTEAARRADTEIKYELKRGQCFWFVYEGEGTCVNIPRRLHRYYVSRVNTRHREANVNVDYYNNRGEQFGSLMGRSFAITQKHVELNEDQGRYLNIPNAPFHRDLVSREDDVEITVYAGTFKTTKLVFETQDKDRTERVTHWIAVNLPDSAPVKTIRESVRPNDEYRSVKQLISTEAKRPAIPR